MGDVPVVDWIQQLENVLEDAGIFLRRQMVGAGVRTYEDVEELEQAPEGPIVEYLIEEGYLSDPRREETGPDELRIQIETVPDSALQAADRAAREITGESMRYTEFISIGLNKCGTDKQTFSALAELWSQKKTQIRGMTAEELRQNLECP